MTILQGDIRQLKSQVMLDTNDGGGPMTSAEVVDGASNGIFDDSSQLDRAYGNISLRKLYLAIQTANTDSYLGAHVILDSIPQDSHVSMTLFTTKNWFDRRSDAQDKVERYLARGPLWAGHLLEMQLEGQRSIQLTLDASDPVPAVGQGMVLVSDEGKSTEYEQYIRVMRIQLDTRKFPVKGESKERVVCTLMLSDPLRYNFEGMSVEDYFNGKKPKAVCRDTTVADAANYFGCTPLVNAVTAGTSVIQMQSIFAQLVPSAQAETPVADVDAAGQSAMLVAGNTAQITVSHIVPVSTTQNWYLGSGILPNSLTVTVLGQTATDSGTVLKTDSGIELGRVDYGIGIISWLAAAGTSPSTTVTANFIPAVAPARPNRTTLLPVTADNRVFNWITTVRPIPSPGSTVVSYISQGKVYWLRDNGSGQLKGADSSFGAGTVNYVTGTISVTTGALPDSNTAILIAWAAPLATYARADLPVKPAAITMSLKRGITPASLTVTWINDGNTKTATDNGHGSLVGDATGWVDYTAGRVGVMPVILPMGGTSFTAAYNYGDPAAAQTISVTSSAADANHQITVTLPAGAAIKPATVRMDVPLVFYDLVVGNNIETVNTTVTLVDDGNGALIRLSDGVQQGTINYTTRQMVLTPKLPVVIQTYDYDYSWGFSTVAGTYLANVDALVETNTQAACSISFQDVGSDTQTSKVVTLDTLDFDLTMGYAETIVGGSARFTLGGLVYVEREGNLYHSISPATGSGIQAGTLNAGTGEAHLTDWVAGQSNSLVLQSLVTQTNLPPVANVAFRLSVVPAKPGSVQLRGTTVDGQILILTPDASGIINTAQAMGTVDYVTGIVQVVFGTETKILSDNRAEIQSSPWYQPSMEYTRDGSTYIRVPVWMQPDSFRYNEVGYTYLPLDADILGLDPVRLPSDGRVPMVRVGNLVVIHHNGVQSLAMVPTVGTVLNAGRANLATVRLIGFDGIEVDPAKYTTDLAAGTVTITQSLTGTATPITFEHRVEDMARVVDVQINGLVQINPPITHDYPLGSLASTALLIGDLQARFDAATVFAQEVMTNTWMDTRQGDVVFAQYNQALYPIVVANRGCETERWAIRFTSATAFVVIGEHVGQIAIGSINQDCSPVNPATNTPYFTLLAAGWGTGWAAGNVLRFNTVSATYPLWMARTIQPGASSVINDQISIEIRGDIDRP